MSDQPATNLERFSFPEKGVLRGDYKAYFLTKRFNFIATLNNHRDISDLFLHIDQEWLESITDLSRIQNPDWIVRELEHLMERAAVQAGGRAITLEQIDSQLAAVTNRRKPAAELATLLQLPFHESVRAWERRLIENALEIAGGNRAEAARRLGIHRRLLYEKLERNGLSDVRERSEQS